MKSKAVFQISLAMMLVVSIFSACGPRHIELENGPGPQGREQVNPREPGDQGDFLLLANPNDLRFSPREWNFDIISLWMGYGRTFPISIDPTDGTARGSGDRKVGSSTCLDATPHANFDDCV